MLYLKDIESVDRPDNIYNRINRPYLVKMHLFKRDTVDISLHLAKALENGAGRILHIWRKFAGLNNPEYITKRTLWLFLGLVHYHTELGGGN